MPDTETTRAVLYARFSPRPGAQECESCERQIEDMTAFCARMGWTIASVHQDRAVSGADGYELSAQRGNGRACLTLEFDERAGLGDAFDALQPGSVLLVRSQDRLSRDPRMAAAYLEVIACRGARFATIEDGGLVGDEDEDRQFMREVKWAIAQWQRRKIKKTTSRRMRAHQAAGRRMSDRVPYGWKADPGSPIGAKGHHLGIVEDPDEQANIVRILELHGQNVGLRSICRRLDEAGIACRGHKWRHTTVRRIIMRVTTK